jgi:DUF4097 and DUF4098 domain-containing protein YvlB
MPDTLFRLLTLLGAAAAVAVHAGCGVDAQIAPATGTFERTLQVDGPVDLSITGGSGRIQIVTGAGDTVRIVGHVRARATPFAEFDATDRVKGVEANPPISQNGNRVQLGEIEVDSLRSNVRIDYDVTVPTRTKIRTRTGSGDQRIGEVLGPVDAAAGSGDLRVGPIGSSVTLKTGSGDIEVLGARGDVAARSGSGDVQAKALNGSVNVHTASGDITVDGRPVGDWTIAAASGDVTLRVPDDAPFVLDATTASGKLRSRHDLDSRRSSSRHHVEGVAHGGGPRLDVRTASGSIRVD